MKKHSKENIAKKMHKKSETRQFSEIKMKKSFYFKMFFLLSSYLFIVKVQLSFPNSLSLTHTHTTTAWVQKHSVIKKLSLKKFYFVSSIDRKSSRSKIIKRNKNKIYYEKS